MTLNRRTVVDREGSGLDHDRIGTRSREDQDRIGRGSGPDGASAHCASGPQRA